MSILKVARPEIRTLHAYEAAEQVDDAIRLNANEAPQPNSIGNFRRPLNRYPEVRPVGLQKALARHFGCVAEQLLVTRGSSEAIDLVIRAFCRAGKDSVVVTSPSFSMYWHFAEVQNARLVEVATQAARDFEVDIDDILEACDDTTRLVIICSPNNPTGVTIPRANIERLLQARTDCSAVVVDEAYIEFADTGSVIELLDRYDNLLVLRTLSKALGFAGARCGAVAGPEDVIRMLGAVQAPYALSTPVVECVENALSADELENAARSVSQVVAERTRVSKALVRFDFVSRVWPSDANFVLIRTTCTSDIMEHCTRHKVLLRHFGGALEDCIRITIGSAVENDTLLKVLESFREPGNG